MAEKVSSGQKLVTSPLRKASVINDVLDAVDFVKQQQMGGGGDAIRGIRQTDIVKVRNDSGGDLVAGRVLQLGGYLYDEMNRRNILFEADTPEDEERFAILGEPIKSGEIGIAHVSGVCIAVVNVGSTTHTRAIPEDGETVLKSGGGGPIRILSELDGTGEQEVVVLIDFAGPSLVAFTLTEDIGNTTSGEASATILEWDFSTTKHSGETVLDNGGIFADGTSGSKGIAVKIGSEYHIIQLACGS